MKRQFWIWLKRFAQRQLDETPDSIRCGSWEITADYTTGEIFVRALGDPQRTRYFTVRL
jgi:hypothetical protein